VKREKTDVTSSVKSYLYQSVKNRCIDYLRKEKSTSEISEIVENINQTPFRDLVEEAELNDRINASINQLPEKCREIFLLCRFEGLKYAEIAKKLNISVKTVEMQMGIALKKLRENLSDYQMINLLVFVSSKKN
jgi:RNA polymerase sigma-70 factor (ECF subfamily)